MLILCAIGSKSEKMRDLFEVGELFRCDVESDDHEMYVREEPRHQKGESVVEPLTTECQLMETLNDRLSLELNPRQPRLKGMSAEAPRVGVGRYVSPDDESRINIKLDFWADECRSEVNFEQFRRRPLYYLEKRDRSAPVSSSRGKDDLVDYASFKVLDAKLQQIKLQADLFENKRDTDFIRQKQISQDLYNQIQEEQELKDILGKLQQTLTHVEQEWKKEML